MVNCNGNGQPACMNVIMALGFFFCGNSCVKIPCSTSVKFLNYSNWGNDKKEKSYPGYNQAVGLYFTIYTIYMRVKREET